MIKMTKIKVTPKKRRLSQKWMIEQDFTSKDAFKRKAFHHMFEYMRERISHRRPTKYQKSHLKEFYYSVKYAQILGLYEDSEFRIDYIADDEIYNSISTKGSMSFYFEISEKLLTKKEKEVIDRRVITAFKEYTKGLIYET